MSKDRDHSCTIGGHIAGAKRAFQSLISTYLEGSLLLELVLGEGRHSCAHK